MQRHAGRHMTFPTDITTKPSGATRFKRLNISDEEINRIHDACAAALNAPPSSCSYTFADIRAALERLKKKTPKPRKPSIRKLVEQAEKAGKNVTSITTPDGTKLDFGGAAPVEPENSWPLDEFRPKETKQ
jgi:hypothetical protein